MSRFNDPDLEELMRFWRGLDADNAFVSVSLKNGVPWDNKVHESRLHASIGLSYRAESNADNVSEALRHMWPALDSKLTGALDTCLLQIANLAAAMSRHDVEPELSYRKGPYFGLWFRYGIIGAPLGKIQCSLFVAEMRPVFAPVGQYVDPRNGAIDNFFGQADTITDALMGAIEQLQVRFAEGKLQELSGFRLKWIDGIGPRPMRPFQARASVQHDR
ncbi:hypothetical protein HJC99_02050 [Candidatus Saccharibacteria bacterium]|nr:hypothetical protein [Candidatus Saccharibacteria bacterium]